MSQIRTNDCNPFQSLQEIHYGRPLSSFVVPLEWQVRPWSEIRARRFPHQIQVKHAPADLFRSNGVCVTMSEPARKLSRCHWSDVCDIGTGGRFRGTLRLSAQFFCHSSLLRSNGFCRCKKPFSYILCRRHWSVVYSIGRDSDLPCLWEWIWKIFFVDETNAPTGIRTSNSGIIEAC